MSVLPVSFSSFVRAVVLAVRESRRRSTAISTARFDMKYAFSPMMSGEDAMPWNGQSLARPDVSFSNVACHMNSPFDSRNAISTPRSPGCFGSRRLSLFVPTSTTPPPTTGLP